MITPGFIGGLIYLRDLGGLFVKITVLTATLGPISLMIMQDLKLTGEERMA
jgi:hypothetical protein